MLNSYILLAISILAEAIASSFVVATKGFTNPKPTIICMLGYSISYGLFGIAGNRSWDRLCHMEFCRHHRDFLCRLFIL